jgi:hypothetical protein
VAALGRLNATYGFAFFPNGEGSQSTGSRSAPCVDERPPFISLKGIDRCFRSFKWPESIDRLAASIPAILDHDLTLRTADPVFQSSERLVNPRIEGERPIVPRELSTIPEIETRRVLPENEIVRTEVVS